MVTAGSFHLFCSSATMSPIRAELTPKPLSSFQEPLLSIRRHDQRFYFHYRLSQDNTNFRGPTVVAFVDDLHHKLRGTVSIVWDEIPIHWGSAVKEFLKAKPSIEAVALPPYAPELNPVD